MNRQPSIFTVNDEEEFEEWPFTLYPIKILVNEQKRINDNSKFQVLLIEPALTSALL